jgi:2-polyprenyl-6-methoxyphenol hydroxylase-like FAD-dependent oxidoreductase
VGLGVRGGPDRDVDVVVGADGYRSRLRSLLHPESRPRIAGYVLWRGNFPADRLEDTAAWQEVLETREWLTVGFEGGHGVMYPIPDFDADGEERLRVNWAIYAPVPDGLTVTEPHSIPPGGVAADWYEQYAALVEAHIPPRLRPVFTSPADEVSIQPIYDELVDTYVGARSLLIGDAATLSRPHTGSGATKALQDARLLETLGATATSWADLLGQYDADRTAVGRSLVELGRRIGRDQVENTPPWGEMTSADYEAWAEGTLSGESLYFWGDQEPADAD